MDKSRRDELQRLRLAHDTRAESFSRLQGSLRIIAWESKHDNAEFDDACSETEDYAAKAFGLFLGDAKPSPETEPGPPPVDRPSDFEGMMQTGAWAISTDTGTTQSGELHALQWQEESAAATSRVIGARLPEDFKHRWATTDIDVRLGKGKARVSLFFDWYSTSPYNLRATAMVQNCYPNQGWIDYEHIHFTVSVGAHSETRGPSLEHGTINTMRPRMCFPIRIDMYGPMWDRLPMVQKAPPGLHEFLVHKSDNTYTTEIGPYRIGWPGYHDLGDSHGGWGIPYHGGGARCWTAGDPLGYALREEEFLGTVARSPIVAREDSGACFFPATPYWLGDSVQALRGVGTSGCHVPPEYAYAPDTSDSDYAEDLADYLPPEYTHQWRMIRAAAMLAPFDSAARWWVIQCRQECLRWLRGNEAGDASSNSLFWSWKRRVSSTPQGHCADWTGRGLAHVIATMAAAQPYIRSSECWREQIIEGLVKIQCEDGSVLAGLGWAKSTNDPPKHNGPIPPDALRAAAREEQLMVCALELLCSDDRSGEEGDLISRLAHSIGMKPGEVYTVNALNAPGFEKIVYCPEYYPGYDHMTQYQWSEFADAAEMNANAMQPGKPLNESPYDYTPRPMWETSL